MRERQRQTRHGGRTESGFRHARSALNQKRPLIELLAEHREISKHVTREQLAAFFCDPMNHLGQAGVMVDRVLAARKP